MAECSSRPAWSRPLLERTKSGQGQVVDAAMVDGTATLMTMFWAFSQTGMYDETQRSVNLLDTGAHFYDTYECADGEYISLGSIEPQFYAELLRLTGLTDDADFQRQMDKSMWEPLKERLTEVFKSKTQAEWCELMEHTDVCFAPVLRMSDAAKHPHNVERATFVEQFGMTQPAPAPRFSRTPGEIQGPPKVPGADTREVLAGLGLSSERIDELFASNAVK
ncbi:MAG: CaiB/BaiF CoA-transferase family protein [Ilumatobacteraceae bacterium]